MSAQFAVGDKVHKLTKTGRVDKRVWVINTVTAVNTLDSWTQRIYKGEFVYTVKNSETSKASNLWNEEHKLVKA